MKKDTFKLFKEFLKWRDKEWKDRVKFTDKQNNQLQRQHMIGGWSPCSIDDGIEEFVKWLGDKK